MSTLMEEMNERALKAGVPLSVQFDVTYRCNERCVHCYLDHDDHGEMTTAEIMDVLDQLAEAGVFFLTFSGGEVLHAHGLLPHPGIRPLPALLRQGQNQRVHDPRERGGPPARAGRGVGASQHLLAPAGSARCHHQAAGIAEALAGRPPFAARRGVKVIIANVLMRQNLQDYPGVVALAKELGATYTYRSDHHSHDGRRPLDPQPGNQPEGTARGFPDPGARRQRGGVLRSAPCRGRRRRDGLPCSASHTFCYISPYGDVYPCVQFPLPTGNVRQQKFLDIWKYSPQMNEVRSIRGRDLPTCSSCSHLGTCTRCPGLAYMEGNMRGPSTQDCEKSFARTGIPSANMLAKAAAGQSIWAGPRLVQIGGVQQSAAPAFQFVK